MNSEKKLGKGLDSLFNRPVTSTPVDNENLVVEIDVKLIDPNPFQPRKIFDENAILELAQSIKENGLIQPVNLRKVGDRYQIITGERRLRAIKSLGQDSVKAIVSTDYNDFRMMEVAIIENIQREDLSVVEISKSFQQLINSCGYTQEQVAEKVGKSRSSVANFLRILKLPSRIIAGLESDEISFGHAKIILSLDTEDTQLTLFELIRAKNLNVRDTEFYAKQLKFPEKEKKKKVDVDHVFVTEQENLLSRIIDGRKVRIKMSEYESGSISIKFSSADELRSIISHFSKGN